LANHTSSAELKPPLRRAPLGYASKTTLARWPEVVCTATALLVLSPVSPLVGAVVTCASSWDLVSAAEVVGVTRTARGTRGDPLPEETLTPAKIAKPTTINAVPSKTNLNVALA
jgi:hypothetical protein